MEKHLAVPPARSLLLGADPAGATDHTGLALLNPSLRCDRGGLELYRLPFLEALALIEHRAGEIAVAVIEDARALPLYAKHRTADRGVRDRIARSVGQVDAHTADLAALLARLSIPTVLRPPVPGAGKWSPAYFHHVTRYPGEASQHEIDACRLIYGYTASALLREAAAEAAPTRPSSPSPAIS